MNIRITGSIKPPRGLQESNGAYLVDLDVEVPELYSDAIHMIAGFAEIAKEVGKWFVRKNVPPSQRGEPGDEPEAQATED